MRLLWRDKLEGRGDCCRTSEDGRPSKVSTLKTSSRPVHVLTRGCGGQEEEVKTKELSADTFEPQFR